jgi:hypothetical protein
MSKINDPFGVLTDIDYQDLMKDFKNIQISYADAFQNADICKYCGQLLQRTINNITNICNLCGIITDEVSEEIININELTNNKLRLVGYNSNHFQPDLYRSDNGNINVLQKKQILNEYKDYRQRFIDIGERAFPLNACEIATEFYNKIQQNCVKRSQNKKAIMAACLWQACLLIDFAPSKIEISKFMQLPHKGIARGNNFIRTLVSNGQLDIDPNTDPIYPEIRTLFLQMSYEDDNNRSDNKEKKIINLMDKTVKHTYKELHDIIYEIINIATTNSIGINSLPRTKVIGTTYIVLKRCTNKELIPDPPIDTKTFCKNKIRKNTIDRFIGEINSYHSYFKKYYELVGLDSELHL